MHLYYFRCKDVSCENVTNAWIGIVFAKTMVDLFWQIVEHADPYDVEVNTESGIKRVKIETILAGGYNVQCLHYRTLVNVK